MLRRRRFISCAICAASAAIVSPGGAQAQPGFTRKILQRTEYPGDKYICVLVEVDIDPNVIIARHTHPGVESGFVVSGSSILSVTGQPDRVLGVGDGYQIPPEAPHTVRNGGEKSRIVVTFIVEKDRPLASPAAE